MAGRVHKHRKNLIRPGNEEYLSFYKPQPEWKPTKPNRLLTIDDVALRAPACEVREKGYRETFFHSPGPAVYDERKKTNKGSDIWNAPFIGKEIEGLMPFTSPGSAAYQYRRVNEKSVYRRHPALTMRPKTEQQEGFIAAAPPFYTLHKTLGPDRSRFKKNPAYTIGKRFDKMEIHQLNPGPAAYQLPPIDINKLKAPAFTMGIKENDSKYGSFSPGPASNENHMVKYNKPAPPRFSFGIRHAPIKAFQYFAKGD